MAGMAAFGAGEAAAEEWDVSLWGKRRAFTEHVEKLAELVAEKTNGEFTLNLSYGGLSNNKENLEGISEGKFEMAQFCVGYHPEKTPTLTVLELPFLGVSELNDQIELARRVYKNPAVVADLARYNATLVMPSPLPEYNLMGTGPVPETLADFDGLSVRATGGIGRALAELGAKPVSLSATEVPGALDSGQITAAAFAPHAHVAFGVIDSAKWWTANLNVGTVHCPVIVNTAAFEALPPNFREALVSSISDSLATYVDIYEDKTLRRWEKNLEKLEIEEYYYTARDIYQFRKASADLIAQRWEEELNAQGVPATELLSLVNASKAAMEFPENYGTWDVIE
ncbi:TRAP transporter substrate-binding protein DctP [Rhodobacteraceae bacterium NNCM2]|nr:TRAP transporter substrate-binding protein DctP [Coraliihabitans acroporae]